MRKFYLTNGNGVQLDLNNRDHFLQKPSGLGMDRKVTYEQVGDYFVVMSNLLKQKNIDAEMVFATYADYREFVKFSEVNPLTLTYVTDEIYNIDVILERINKSEKETGGLYCKIRLSGISTFYKTYEMRNNGTENTGKVYNYKYNYTYTNSQASTLSFDVDSIMDCPAKLIIIGPAVNPTWSYRLNDKIVSTGRINKIVGEGRRLIIDTTKIPYSIVETDNNGNNVEDVYRYSDFSTQRFLLLQNGSNVIRVAHEGSNDLNMIVERRELYATV